MQHQLADIANPTVHIGLGQLRRVVNRIIEIYGKPAEIVVELARDLKMNKEDKDEERRKIRENETANRRREEQIRAAQGVPSSHLLRKLRLWEEQKYGSEYVCPFTGKPISFSMAIDDRTEIEHILPFSKTLDDSMANKVLALKAANTAKKDQSPYDAFHGDPKIGEYQYRYNEILMRADDLPPNKRWQFHPDAMERFENEKDFLDRQLNETKYLSRIARTYLAHLYNEKGEGSLRVRAIPGKLTAMLRGKWGLSALHRDHNLAGGDFEGGPARKNRDDQRHHAIDAFVVGMTDQRLLQRISELNSEADRKRLIEAIPEPWPGFTPDALREQFDRLVVSYKPDHGTPGLNGKTTGALHNDTAYGLIEPGKNGNWKVVSRAALKGFLTPKDMDAALPAVRDKALREALTEAWQEFKKSAPEKDAQEDSLKKTKNAAARAVTSTGLHPSIGLHHANRGNPMCLIDDLMEPFRPLIDFLVAKLLAQGATEVDPSTKRKLAKSLSLDMATARGTTPVSTCLERLSLSLATAFETGKSDLDLPETLLPLELPEPGQGASAED